MPTSITCSSSPTESELDLQMQALVKLKEAKAEEKRRALRRRRRSALRRLQSWQQRRPRRPRWR